MIIVIPFPFPHVPRHVCFVEIAMVSILLQSANWTIVGTGSVTLNSEKGLLFAISCFMKKILTRNKEGRNQDKMLQFCK